jgi:putative membrane protein
MKNIPRSLSRKPLLIGAVALSLAAAAGVARAADPMTSATGGDVPSSDRKFIEKATIGNMAEVKLGKLAQEQGSSQAVRDFGARMVQDHTKANAELQKVATAKGVTVPGTIDKAAQSDYDKLAKKSGADFDKAYVNGMVSDHKTDIAEFQKEVKSGKDADLQAFASKTLPTLEDHLKMIQGIKDSMK